MLLTTWKFLSIRGLTRMYLGLGPVPVFFLFFCFLDWVQLSPYNWSEPNWPGWAAATQRATFALCWELELQNGARERRAFLELLLEDEDDGDGELVNQCCFSSPLLLFFLPFFSDFWFLFFFFCFILLSLFFPLYVFLSASFRFRLSFLVFLFFSHLFLFFSSVFFWVPCCMCSLVSSAPSGFSLSFPVESSF